MSRPTLLPHLRPLWRDRTNLQLGTDPARAVVLEFDDPATARLLGLLDGVRTETAVLTEANALGVPPEPARAALAALREAGMVVDAHALVPIAWPVPVRERLYPEAVAMAAAAVPGRAGASPATRLRRRAAARVLVAGTGRLVDPIATTLDAAGVGRVLTAATERPAHLRAATFVVRAGAEHRPAALVAGAYARRRLAHLAVAVRDATVVVGPLVPAAGSPCLACLDLHRRDRDPAWPHLAQQLATQPATSQNAAAATVLAGAAFAAAQVLSHLDGDRPRTRGATVEIGEPGLVRRRTWSRHPRCDCRRPRRSRDGGHN
jgi:bacteriocin biosynthesis cyclodehydratase domain-containing protein